MQLGKLGVWYFTETLTAAQAAEAAQRIESLGYEKIRVRSGLTCDASMGLCARCYGMDLSRGALAERLRRVPVREPQHHRVGEQQRRA